MEAGGITSIFLSCGLCVSIICNIIQYYNSRKTNEKIMLLRCSSNQKIIENNQKPDIENQIDNFQDTQENKSDDETSSSSIIMLEESGNSDDVIFNIQKKNEIKMMISGNDL